MGKGQVTLPSLFSMELHFSTRSVAQCQLSLHHPGARIHHQSIIFSGNGRWIFPAAISFCTERNDRTPTKDVGKNFQ
jgi:hypothetical protein